MTQAPARPQEDGGHVLPVFVQWFIDNLLLPLLILGTAIFNGSLFTRGISPPQGTLFVLGIPLDVPLNLLYAAGAATAGVSILAALNCSIAFERKRWMAGIGYGMVTLVLCLAEFWANISERSELIATTPADQAVLGFFNFPTHSVLTVSLIIAALMIPFTGVVFGFVKKDRKSQLSAGDIEQEELKGQLALVRAENAAKRRAVQAGGIGKAARAAREGLRAQEGIDTPPLVMSGDNDEEEEFDTASLPPKWVGRGA